MENSFRPDLILALALATGLSLVLPLGLAIWSGRKEAAAAWLGSLGFIIPQLLLRLPLLAVLGNSFYWQYLRGLYPWLALVFYPLTAALFETAGRFLVLAILHKRGLGWLRSRAAGLGHGVAEALALVGINQLLYLVLVLLPPAWRPLSLWAALDVLAQTSPWLFVTAGLERVFVLPIHLFLTCLLAWSWQKKKAASRPWPGHLLAQPG